jgi:acyl-CoA thioester hydrolase
LEEGHRINLAVVEAECRYRKPARYDDEVIVETWVAQFSPRLVEFRYEIRREGEPEALAEGRTRHVFVGADLKPTKLPEEFRAYFQP